MTDRSKSIGASSVAALFGCSPWQSEFSLWLEKTGLVEQQADTERLRAGNYLEEAILTEWRNRNGFEALWSEKSYLVANDVSRQLKTHPFISATPDAIGKIVEDGKETLVVGDVKTVTRERRADWNDGVPEYYRLQLQQQMLVIGASRAVLIAQFGFDELSHEWIDADPALQEEIVKRCCEFWKRVQGELPPPDPDGSDATTNALRRRKLEAKAIELSSDVRDLSDRLANVERYIKEHEKEAKRLKNLIRAAMGDATTGVWPDGSGWRITTVNRKEAVVRAGSYTTMKRIAPKDAVEAWDGVEE